MTVESLTPITEADLLEKVKNAINLKGNDFQDDAISVWIGVVKFDLLGAGVAADVVESTLAVGCIATGVDDRWASHRDAYSGLFFEGVERLRNVVVKGAE